MSRRATLRLLALAGLWGSSFLWIKVAVASMPPVAVAFGRLGLGTLVLWLVLVRSGRRVPRARRFWIDMAVLGVVSGAVPYVLIPWGEQFITSGLAAIFNATTPLFTAVLGWAVREEVLGARSVAGVAVGFLGTALLFGDDLAGIGGDHVPGQLALLAAAASYGVGFVYASGRVDKRVAAVPAAGQQLTGTLLLVPFLPAALPEIRLTPLAAVAVLWLGVLATGLAYLLYFSLIEEVGPTAAATVTYLLPVVALALGAVFLAEPIRPLDVAALVLIVVGISAVSRGRARFRGYRPA